MVRPRVVLADDHPLVLETVEALLDADGDFEVVAAVGSGTELLRVLETSPPDLVVLDLRMPGTDGLDCLRSIRDRHPAVKVVVLSGADEPRLAQLALRLGAAAYVKKEVDPRDLTAILRQALEGTVVSHAAGLALPDDRLDEVRRLLTPGELAVLESLARGLVNKQIAVELEIAQQTVKFHLTNVYRKLGVANRTEAIKYAFDCGLSERSLAAV
jgi:DNA-binding NarL/FixJ family response regulator